ncbi:MAG: hypothetical protein AAF677_03355 [Pseudomonadota bacterium]
MAEPDALPGSPLTRFRHEIRPGIGHNQGPPLDPGRSGRAFAWRKARAELMPRLPLEVVRRRVRRAKELGLAYPAYASILLGTGRDVVAFLFTGTAIADRLRRGIDPAKADKLRTLSGCERRLIGVPADAAPEGALFAAIAPPPGATGATVDPGTDPRTWGAARLAITAALVPAVAGGRVLPADAVVMVGVTAVERGWADAAALAKFLPAEQYFDAP